MPSKKSLTLGSFSSYLREAAEDWAMDNGCDAVMVKPMGQIGHRIILDVEIKKGKKQTTHIISLDNKEKRRKRLNDRLNTRRWSKIKVPGQTKYSVTGVDISGKRFRINTSNRIHALGINLAKGTVWENSGITRKAIKKVGY